MKQLIYLFLLFPIFVFSQNPFNGIVKNAKTNEPLSFANITTSDQKIYYTNTFGKFEIHSNKLIQSFTVSYVGFYPKTIKYQSDINYYEVLLAPKTEQLNEVVIEASDNLALRIIKQVLATEPQNNILKKFDNFNYDAYTKIVVTANPDSISSKIDTVFSTENEKRVLKKIDSSSFKMKNILDKRHLYISEKISNHHYKKGSEIKEQVLATRMAGLKQPFFELLALNFSDFHIYDANYIVAGNNYPNPISSQGINEYRFKILDTVKTSKGRSFMIYFKPKKIKTTAGLEGLLFIDDTHFAITKLILELKAIIYVRLNHEFEYDTALNNWFSCNKELVITKGMNQNNISLFGNMVKFESSKKNDHKKEVADFIYFSSKTFNSNLKINSDKKIPSFAEKIRISDDVHQKSEEFWNLYRTDSITQRDSKTYIVIDSIAQKYKIEHKIELFRELSKGYVPLNFFSLNLGKILTLNQYEGLRLGFGGETNHRFSTNYKIEGYLAYGTKDNDFKYHYGASTRLNKYHNTWIGLTYTNDLKEAAAMDFMLENTSFSLLNPRNLNISDFYHHKNYTFQVKHDILPELESQLQLSAGNYETVFKYAFQKDGELKNDYDLTNLSIGFLYRPFDKYMKTPVGKTKISSGYTDFLFQTTQSFNDLLDGNYNFTRFIFRASHRIPFYNENYLYLMLQGGLVVGDAPITHLFNATPNYSHKYPWIKRVTFGGKNSFETMQYNEFLSDRFVMFQVHQHLKKFNLGKFKPQVTLISRAAFGNLSNKENHQQIQYKTMEKGYFESGMEMNNLFKGFGASAFYRFGPYHHQDISNNIALKVTYKLSLGF